MSWSLNDEDVVDDDENVGEEVVVLIDFEVLDSLVLSLRWCHRYEQDFTLFSRATSLALWENSRCDPHDAFKSHRRHGALLQNVQCDGESAPKSHRRRFLTFKVFKEVGNEAR